MGIKFIGSRKENSVSLLKEGFHFAMHGGGDYRAITHSNTLEAYLFWRKRGETIFEFDICHCSDDVFVAFAHNFEDKKYLQNAEVFTKPDSCTSQWFLHTKLFPLSTRGLTPLSLEFLVNELINNPELIIMFDLYGLFNAHSIKCFTDSFVSLLNGEKAPLERILFETYNLATTKELRARIPAAHVIYGIQYEKSEWLDAFGNNPEGNFDYVNPSILLENDICFVSYPWYYTFRHPGEIEEFHKAGICVLSRTNSNKNYKELKKKGVTINLVDYRYSLVLFPLQRLVLVFQRLIINRKKKNR